MNDVIDRTRHNAPPPPKLVSGEGALFVCLLASVCLGRQCLTTQVMAVWETSHEVASV